MIRTRVSEMLEQLEALNLVIVMALTRRRVISVEIHGQRYPIRSALDPEYVRRLAALRRREDARGRRSTPTGDTLRLAVLAALNIADELFRCRDATRARDGELAERAGELERLLDRVLLA